MKKLIVALSLCLVLLLGIVFVLHSLEGQDPVVDTKPTETEQVNYYQVHFVVLDRNYSSQQVREGSRPQPLQLQIQGLEVAYWTDKEGKQLDPFTTEVTSDVTYLAVTYPKLQKEKTYLFVDEKGHLRPDDYLTGQELEMALTSLAESGATEYFPTMPAGDAEVTLVELTEVLKHFFTSSAVDGVLANVQPEKVTRGAFAQAMSRLLEYTDGDTVVIAPGTKIPTDITQDRQDAIALLQASVGFFKDPAGQAWTTVDLPVPYDPGFVNIDGWLYYVKEDGYFLKNDTVDTLQFGEDGRYTSGDATLDTTVATILAQIIAENPDGTRMEILRDVYDHCHTQYTYRRTYDHPSFGGHGWEIQRANAMFETGKGNCYSYAAIFWALSRGLGYPTRAISGTCLSDEQPHSWCIIEIDGADYFFDPEWQYAYTERGVYDKDMFMIPMNKISYWGYKWVE